MRLHKQGTIARTALLATATAFGLACSDPASAQIAQQINLATDDNTFLVVRGLRRRRTSIRTSSIRGG